MALKSMNTVAKVAFRAQDKMTGPIKRMEKSVDKFGKKSKKSGAMASKSFSNVGGSVLRLTKRLAALSVAAAGFAAFSIVKTGADLQSTMKGIEAISGTDGLDKVSEQILHLGETTEFTANQAAEGALELARAGFSTKESLAALPEVLALASAGNLELAEATMFVTKNVRAFGLEADEAGRVADVLAKGSTMVSGTVQDIGVGLANLAPVAKQFNMDLEESVAAVGSLINVGIDSSTAGTSVATMLTKMASATDPVVKKFDKLGATFVDAKGDLLPFDQLMREMAGALNKVEGNKGKVALAAELTGLRGQKPLLTFVKQIEDGTFALDEMTLALALAKGEAERMRGVKQDTLAGDWLRLTSAIEGVKVALFDVAEGPLRGIVQSMTRWVGANKELILSKFTKFVQWLVKNLPVLWEIVKEGAAMVGEFLAGAFDDAGGKIEKLLVQVESLAKSLHDIADAVGGLQKIGGFVGDVAFGPGRTEGGGPITRAWNWAFGGDDEGAPGAAGAKAFSSGTGSAAAPEQGESMGARWDRLLALTETIAAKEMKNEIFLNESKADFELTDDGIITVETASF